MDIIDTQCLHSLRRFTADFIKVKTGKGPKVVRTYSEKDKIFLELEDYLTPIEKEITKDQEGIKIVKNAREKFSANLHDEYLLKANELFKHRILESVMLWDIENDRAFEVITLDIGY
ncbi:hypothetical protein SBF1_970001 [Candidatus Desulfosporosinus infrequens]|uniref:Na+-translocating membrane potential-generating system MpsC domain-containing protein n=1 Tax=Candidatus Desulfosporosinus infrequens TaxID=2043169 RepID=A0A2U3LYZ7_9FIRM|nr:hypothetical protein SBF1_970001 [Candidatus Desulfosporosinus infrequens]